MSFGVLFHLYIDFVMDPYYHSVRLFPISVLDGLEKQLVLFYVLAPTVVQFIGTQGNVLLRSGQNKLGIELK